MRYAKIVLSGSFRETGLQSRSLAAAGEQPFRYDQFLVTVEKILANRKVGRVLIEHKSDFRLVLFSSAEDVRRQVERLQEAGKEVWFFSKSYDSVPLYIASAAGKRIIHPLGRLSFAGFSRSFLFFKRMLDRHGIEAEVIRRGRYKSAGDRFRTDRMDRENREQYERYFREIMEEAKERTQTSLGKTNEELEALIGGRILDAKAAEEEGWVDESATLAKIEDRWKKEEKVKPKKIRKVGRSCGKGRKKIAVLVFEGAIIDGKTRHHPLIGQAIGSESFISHIEKLKKERRVKAVVLRINSGGGSATASEDVLEALSRLAAEKPLVVSMSEMAGSGGYWIACAAERLFVRRTTLTGSIGVIVMMLGMRKFLETHGITESTVRTGPHADLGSPFRPVTEQERSLMDGTVESLYRRFLEKAADFRKKETREIERLAAGRVWSGADAVENGLADELGGLGEAVSYLETKLGTKRTKVVFYPEIKYGFLEKRLYRGSKSADSAGLFPSGSMLRAGDAFSLLSSAHALNRRPLAVVPELIGLQNLFGERW